MTASIDLAAPAERRTLTLTEGRLTIGSAEGNDLPIAGDPTVSRLHAIMERYPVGWCVRDLGSRNGTFVNGDRIFGERALRHGDEIRIGRSRLTFRAGGVGDLGVTEAPAPAPELTHREHDVLVGLCRPLLEGDAFSEPASVKRIAAELVVTSAAVKQHLQRLYDKFGIGPDDGVPRRVRLANEALNRGAVSLADLRAGT